MVLVGVYQLAGVHVLREVNDVIVGGLAELEERAVLFFQEVLGVDHDEKFADRLFVREVGDGDDAFPLGAKADSDRRC